MSRVFVTQEDPTKNLSAAKEFGQIKVLLPPTQVTFDATWAIEEMFKKLEEFKDEDYLLLVGDPVIMILAASIVSWVTGGKYNILKWDRETRTYNPLTIDLRLPND